MLWRVASGAPKVTRCYEPRIACEADFRAESQTFHRARTEALDQCICFFDEGEGQRNALRPLQVNYD